MTDQYATTAAGTPEQRLINQLSGVSVTASTTCHRLQETLLTSAASPRNDHLRPLNPVLRASLAHLKGVQLSEVGWRAAASELLLNPTDGYDSFDAKISDYKLLLGDFLPNDIVQAASNHTQQSAYENGSNATAADDWFVYAQRLVNTPPLVSKFPTGIDSVDDDLAGGITGLTLLLGDKGVGKTSLMINCLCNAITEPQTAVLFYSLDMPKGAIYGRIACHELGVGHRGLQSYLAANINSPAVIAMKEKLSRIKVVERDYSVKRSVYNDVPPESGMSDSSIMSDATALLAATGANRILIVVDLFQKMIVPSTISPLETDTYRLDMFNQLMQQLRRHFRGNRFAFLVSSEMRKRDLKKTVSRPTKDDMKGDGRIASDADCVLILSTSSTVNENANEVLLDIDKGREGIVRGEHKLMFHHKLGRFDSLNRAAEQNTSGQPTSSTPVVYDEE